jgi:hypothetical protein
MRVLIDAMRTGDLTRESRSRISLHNPGLKMYSRHLLSFLLMIFEDRGLKQEPVSFEDMLEHDFLINFHVKDADLNPDLYCDPHS